MKKIASQLGELSTYTDQGYRMHRRTLYALSEPFEGADYVVLSSFTINMDSETCVYASDEHGLYKTGFELHKEPQTLSHVETFKYLGYEVV